ncbi:hypothetical protein [Jeotgalibacillus terrae]|uniref:Uncharacterized protein n=1 Tax=Jeotgalibacillus terrae TaxID=587735 RepID=A0ABW5ZNW8_9BACL|nr:hypothetical protein [Jeotgalibacillus terrae]MBM7580493.1 small nuclear ribonucleoprotein (snRNP)-like protein [Jeotgalibacillus terrae]
MYSDLDVESWIAATAKPTESYPSPTGNGSSEEILLQKRYLELANIFLQMKYNPEKGKILLLQSFLNEKRNQTVEVIDQDHCLIKGRAQEVGRNYLVLTSYFTKCWIPYSGIREVKTPYGAPEFASTHQYVFYDNDLRRKLLKNFGATVAKRSKLKGLFYRETLKTSLQRWKNSRLKVEMANGLTLSGKLIRSEDDYFIVTVKKVEKKIHYNELKRIEKFRFN